MSRKRQKIWFYLLALILLVNSGCNSPDVQLTPVPKIMEIKPSSTPQPTVAMKIVTNTPVTPAFTPSPKPKPTFSQAEKEGIISRLLTGDYLCQMPCYAGIDPGVTKWSETEDFFMNLSKERVSQPSSGIYTFGLKYPTETAYVFIYVDRGLTEFLMAPRYEFPVDKLLTQYGQPDEIYIQILDVLPVDKIVPYTIYLFYSKGFVVTYTGNSVKGSIITVCPKNVQKINNEKAFFWLWNGSSNESFEDIITKYESKFYPADASLSYLKLEDLSKYDTEFFFKTYKNEKQTKCLELKNPYIGP